MTITPDEFSELAASRHSVRDFLSDPVPQKILERILADAAQAPSWSNTRPFMIALAQGEQADRLRTAYVAEFNKTLAAQHKERGAIVKLLLSGNLPDGDFKVWAPYPKDLRAHSFQVGKRLYEHMNVAREDRGARDQMNRRNCEAFGAPVIGFVFIHRDFAPFAAHDAGLMLQTLFLSAKANGVDSCPIGVLATWRSPVDVEFNVPKNYQLITGFGLGYASDAPINDFRAERRPVALVSSKEASTRN